MNKRTARLWIVVPVLAGIVICAALALVFTDDVLQANLVKAMSSAEKVLVIDPGHGGIDGGAVSSDGISEKDINLSIAKKLNTMAKKEGWHVVMTRTEDVELDQGGQGSIRSRKTKDICSRKEIFDSVDADAVVSIHLNSFKEDRSVRGAQVFYSAGEVSEDVLTGSKALGEAIQKSLVKNMNDGTDRKAMGKKDVYILKEPKAPTAIVECGFLSNAKDVSGLKDEKYQQKVAEAIFCGIREFLDENAKNVEKSEKTPTKQTK